MPDFSISRQDWNKILNYARAREQQNGDEIGGMAIAKINEDGDWIISHPTILKQTTTGGTCTLDKEALSEYYIDMAMKHGTDIQFVWWHSHAKMGAFWSGTDTNTMTEYKSGNWSMFLVVNVYGEYKFRVQVWNPLEAHLDTELEILDDDYEFKIPKRIMNEVEKKCGKEIVVTTKYNYAQQGTLFHKKIDYSLQSELDVMDYNMTYGYGHTYDGSLDIQTSPIQFLMQHLEMGNTKFCDGLIEYDKYKQVLEEFNDTLEKLEAEKDPKIRVVIHSKKTLLDIIMTHNPADFITVDGSPISDIMLNRGVL